MRWLMGKPLRVRITKSVDAVSVRWLARFWVEEVRLGGMVEGG